VGEKLELAIAILNGAVGDYLAKTENGLRTEMSLVRGGAIVPVDRASLAAAVEAPSAHVVVFLHGLMCTETIWNYPGTSSGYPELLERDRAVTSLTVRYNTGLSIPENGALFDGLLRRLVEAYPVPITTITIVGYSMGGLVARAAFHTAASAGESPWLPRVARAIYVGTPHRGAPLERVGRAVTKLLEAIPDPVTRLVGELAELRSAGVKDLGDADLRPEDRAKTSLRLTSAEHPVPLLDGLAHHLVVGTLTRDGSFPELFGDAIVPVSSASFRGARGPIASLRVCPGLSHTDLPHHGDVYAALLEAFDTPERESP
jgi:triacylglycerol lipase